ncbi:hypothetical protein NQ315_014245 [Exocentrus adspersus]|uniref:Uncharacterized protein n=1 Tax=Exocentrus adspersus TaxID=1586481 RepID=A0AAV8VA50_9CUCU|nr:hypothetical protein NQ315_014245 [Exocentrus adspersus]
MITVNNQKGHKFLLEPATVEKYDLPSNEISIQPIIEIFHIEKNKELKMLPRLKENVWYPSHFEKMCVGLSMALLNHDVAATITHLIRSGKIRESHETTAWFLRILFKWFSIMSSTHASVALSHHNSNIYEETVAFLKEFIDIIQKIHVTSGDTGIVHWKPFSKRFASRYPNCFRFTGGISR